MFDWIPGDADHPFRRFTIEFEFAAHQGERGGQERTARYRAITAAGELTAVAMAYGRLRKEHEAAVLWLGRTRVVAVEDEWESDPESDLIQYWEVS